MSDGADDFFKPGMRPTRRKPATDQEENTPIPEEMTSGENGERPRTTNTPNIDSSPPDQGSKGEISEVQPPPTRRRDANAALDKLFKSPTKNGNQPSQESSLPQRTRPRTSPNDLLARLSEAQPEAEKASSTSGINPEFERFLPPETWRRLNSASPQRRILINAQERMRSVLFQLSTFLPGNLVQEILLHPVPGLVSGKMLQGSLLFSDVSGFTALSERLAVLGPAGAERLTTVMNHYFGVILDIIAASGGILIKFAGDATLVYFPHAPRTSSRLQSQHRMMAARTGLRMLEAMSEFADIEAGSDRISLKMKIGIASGEFLAASIGSADRMEYAVLGPAVNNVLNAEGASTAAGQLIVDQGTAEGLDGMFTSSAHKGDFYLLNLAQGHSLDRFEIQTGSQRTRSGINWSTAQEEILQNMGTVLQQIKAVLPYIPEEISNRVISQYAQRRVDGEFRPVVTMFCNFNIPETLLRLWGHSGVARFTSILSAYFNAMHQAIHRFGGVVARIDPYSKGTKMLILFGAPVSHEDDPQRAVSTALTMNMALEQVNERLMQKFSRSLPSDLEGPLIQHRIGITYGEIFATEVGASTRREYTVMGDDVNLAARLMSVGKTGQILLGSSIFEAVRHDFLTTTLNPIRVKGKSKPIPVYQVDAPTENILINRLESIGPLIGREAELATARRFLEAAAAGKGQLLVIEGPAGIGKTHLSDVVLLEGRNAGARLLAAQCRSYAEGTPYSALSLLLRSAAGITNIDPPQLAMEKFERLIAPLQIPAGQSSGQARRLIGALMGITPPYSKPSRQSANIGPSQDSSAQENAQPDYLEQLKDIPSTRRGSRLDFLDNLSGAQVSETGQSWETVTGVLDGSLRKHTYECLVHLLRTLSAEQPLILFFEDAQWLDAGTTDLLVAIHSALTGLPILVLLAARNCTSDLLTYAERIQLTSLPEVETTNLVANILVSDLGPLIFQQTGGNPLFVSEVTRWIQRTRRVAAADLEDVLRTSDVLQKLILSRVEKLSEISRQVIRAAAVIGQGFRVSILQAALGNAVDEVSLSAHLRTLVDASLLQPLEGGVDSRYVFQQELVRTVLYNSISFDRRRELHGRIADSLVSSKPSRRQVGARIGAFLNAPDVRRDERRQALIAFHQEGAERFVPAALTHLRAAALARQRNDWTDAQAFYENALNALAKCQPATDNSTDHASASIMALIGLADMAIVLGNRPEDAIARLEKAASLAEQALLQEEFAALHLRLAVLYPIQDKDGDALNQLSKIHHLVPTALRPFASVVQAWLENRANSHVPLRTLKQARQDAAGTSFLETLIEELCGCWSAAVDGYMALGNAQSAAMIHIRWGDELAAASDHPAADKHYLAALQLWHRSGRNQAGLALAAYRHAEMASRNGRIMAARRALSHAVRHLKDSPAPVRQEGRIIFKKAHKLLDSSSDIPWPAWRWQFLDDQLKLALLYRQFIGLGL